MSNIPADRHYTRSHEWVRLLADGNVEIGISDHAQAALGDLVFVELPEPGRTLKQGEACAVVESVKAASDVYAPLPGTVLAINEQAQPRTGQQRSLRQRLDAAAQAHGRGEPWPAVR
jgi:glycine cleavage system H protein